jgi:ABC-type xylose transport system permease subunit
MFDFIDAKTVYTIVHLLGVAFGAGGAFISDGMFFASLRDKQLSETEFRFLKIGGNFVWFGLFLFFVSGVLLTSLDPERYFASSKFIAKMVIVGVIVVNGIIFHMTHLKRLKKCIGVYLPSSRDFQKYSKAMYISGAISVVSWTFALVLGAFRSVPYSPIDILLVYGLAVVVAIAGALFMRKRFLSVS